MAFVSLMMWTKTFRQHATSLHQVIRSSGFWSSCKAACSALINTHNLFYRNIMLVNAGRHQFLSVDWPMAYGECFKRYPRTMSEIDLWIRQMRPKIWIYCCLSILGSFPKYFSCLKVLNGLICWQALGQQSFGGLAKWNIH